MKFMYLYECIFIFKALKYLLKIFRVCFSKHFSEHSCELGITTKLGLELYHNSQVITHAILINIRPHSQEF